MVSSANNRTTTEAWPVYIGNFFETEGRSAKSGRCWQPRTLFRGREFQEMQSDFRLNDMAEIWEDVLAVISDQSGFSESEKDLLKMLDSWDGQVLADSSPAAFFEVFILHLAENLFKDELGEDLFTEFCGSSRRVHHAMKNLFADKQSSWWDDLRTPGTTERPEHIIRRCFFSGLEEMEDRLGRDPESWRWGDLHTLTLRHPMGKVAILNRIFRLNRGPYPIGGSFHTLCPYRFSLNNPFDSDNGASQRHIYDLKDWDLSLAVIPTGVSGIPSSRYYCDQTDAYIRNIYFHDPFSRKAVEEEAVYIMTILPLN